MANKKKPKKDYTQDLIKSKMIPVAEINNKKGAVFTAKDMYKRNNARDKEHWHDIAKMRTMTFPNKKLSVSNDAVIARIDYGRLIADCECGGAEYVDPDDLRFFCHSCGNVNHKRAFRKIYIPKEVMNEL